MSTTDLDERLNNLYVTLKTFDLPIERWKLEGLAHHNIAKNEFVKDVCYLNNGLITKGVVAKLLQHGRDTAPWVWQSHEDCTLPQIREFCRWLKIEDEKRLIYKARREAMYLDLLKVDSMYLTLFQVGEQTPIDIAFVDAMEKKLQDYKDRMSTSATFGYNKE
ncbi:hypothetical protein L2E82_37644 [Cichorium intybus]|uniref:Uncharacterized protein n=1 Tax=Cichorium intybus TaxID=13427 RepID=A0ACB9AFU3_CICIN|nr:hypothetical protein L2E82_37644 [Cichorium intybus]